MKTRLCQHGDEVMCVWCVGADLPEPTIEEALDCMKGEFVDEYGKQVYVPNKSPAEVLMTEGPNLPDPIFLCDDNKKSGQ